MAAIPVEIQCRFIDWALVSHIASSLFSQNDPSLGTSAGAATGTSTSTLLRMRSERVETLSQTAPAFARQLTRSLNDVLMDIQMPEMDGVTATQRIRESWAPEQQPRIIAVTAHALKDDRRHYLSQGMDDYISKPIGMKELIQALNKCSIL